jgi:hypothetical protein
MKARKSKRIKSNPGTLYSRLLHVFGVRKHAGIIYGNPPDGLERVPVWAKQLTPPSLNAKKPLIAPAKKLARIALLITICAFVRNALYRIRPEYSYSYSFPLARHKEGYAGNETYGHSRREHSIAQAQRVTFVAVFAKHAEMVAFPANA